MPIFQGSAVALVTPFYKKDKGVDYEKLEELIQFQCKNKTDAIVICGTTGEAPTLTKEEHILCIRRAVEFTKGRVPVIAGAGSNCTRTAVETSKEAKRCGADALLIVTPYYNKPTQRGLIDHFTFIAQNVDLPILLYNVGSRTGCNMKPETAATLILNVDNIVGIKEASGNISQSAKIMNLTDGKAEIYSGNDDQILPVLSIGGKGVVSVLANILPEKTHRICEEFFKGKIKESRKILLELYPLIETLFSETNPIPIKEAMDLIGMEAGPLRMPLGKMGEENRIRLKEELKKQGLLSLYKKEKL